MRDCDVCWVALNESTIPITQGSSFNICEHVQVSLKAEEPVAMIIKVAMNWPFWMHFNITDVSRLVLEVLLKRNSEIQHCHISRSLLVSPFLRWRFASN